MGRALKPTVVHDAQQRPEGTQVGAALPVVLGQLDAERVADVDHRRGGVVVDGGAEPDRLLARACALAHRVGVGLKLV